MGIPKHLIDGAVEKATRAIVTDAVESRLRDESHTRETYLKHEKELSQSVIPGVIPISKQLFSPSKQSATTVNTFTSENDMDTSTPAADESLKENSQQKERTMSDSGKPKSSKKDSKDKNR